ncbi:MAG: NUDIX domain-containing protein [Bacteroidota bacterium]
MYKVFVNNKPVFLTGGTKEIKILEKTTIIRLYEDTNLQDVIDSYQYDENAECLYIVTEHPERTWSRFRSMYRIVVSAGGIVKNSAGKFLFILRKGKWDLPKGKVEEGENIADAAQREISEECGIHELIITRKLLPTYHTYNAGKLRILKETNWFEFLYEKNETPVPQSEEYITEVRWFDFSEIDIVLKNTYTSIAELVHKEIVLKNPAAAEQH